MKNLFVTAMTVVFVVSAEARAQAKEIASDGKASLPAVQQPAKKQQKPDLMPYSANALQAESIKLGDPSPQPNGLIAPMY